MKSNQLKYKFFCYDKPKSRPYSYNNELNIKSIPIFKPKLKIENIIDELNNNFDININNDNENMENINNNSYYSSIWIINEYLKESKETTY